MSAAVISVAGMRELAQRALIRHRVSSELSAQVVADLLENELVGYPSHGLLRLVDYVDDIRANRLDPAARPRIVRCDANVAIVDGHRAFGVLVRRAIVDALRQQACDHAVAVVCLREAPHLGRLAAIGRALAGASEHPLAVMGFCNFRGRGLRVAAPGGKLARLCTNPLLLAFPSDDADPIVLDMSTSAVSEGYIRRSALEGRPLPPGCLTNAEGQSELDPSTLYATPPQATMEPLGGKLAGHKGYALAVAMEMFAGALAGADHVAQPGEPGNGGMFIAIDPARLPPGLAAARSAASAIAAHCRETGLSGQPARMAGEGANQRSRVAAAQTVLTLPTTTLAAIEALAGHAIQGGDHVE
ncbi:hypothetical protein WT60_25860 [Burkholderia sp. MSMB617WGS]|uniref:Ldh family oxidoreductase n=1 Tax=Burkholderia TaxID=32008 RepID=UPI0005321511|nr:MULTISPECIES: Ldh family oxidoreductase [Burkholderia]AOK50252.1 hypothetical protein WT60_25860 [Burkholderia sp. MSMB617WGS]KGS08054.1 malate/L-lactate dehydrogenase family protein [Burkholderia sp. ABCPW 111]KWZ47456.1 hypothetical protein WS73_02390 [Burkholderia savannae]